MRLCAVDQLKPELQEDERGDERETEEQQHSGEPHREPRRRHGRRRSRSTTRRSRDQHQWRGRRPARIPHSTTDYVSSLRRPATSPNIPLTNFQLRRSGPPWRCGEGVETPAAAGRTGGQRENQPRVRAGPGRPVGVLV
ncbi:hypothetical protein NDU88_003828 [Pleurodeles waltl]|uniref:Uncharacterized protein n=1 Tax=Pleurodeles waltl TaxID=8319 RepID=A0AAV7PD78_PLEWA|nr:hypothetical protein NDU88_003828 [Pleurodeles waltl]